MLRIQAFQVQESYYQDSNLAALVATRGTIMVGKIWDFRPSRLWKIPFPASTMEDAKDRCFSKFCQIHRKTHVLESLFWKRFRLPGRYFIKKETLMQAFSSEFCKIEFFTSHLQTTASVGSKNSFKTDKEANKMPYEMHDLPLSDISHESTWKFTKILERNLWRSFI